MTHPAPQNENPLLPDSGYRVHDHNRPQMPLVDAPAGAPPSDAIVLFDGTNTDAWVQAADDSPCAWKLDNGELAVVPKTGDIKTKQAFGDCQLHVEFKSPTEITGDGQARGNSGVFLMGRYEIQVLDNYENPTYPDGTVGAIYGQTPPLVNSIRKPGEWNDFDLIWKAPVFKNGALESPALVTVLLNGVVQQHATALHGPTQHKKLPEYIEHPDKEPLKLQDHRDLVRFRNIWIREL